MSNKIWLNHKISSFLLSTCFARLCSRWYIYTGEKNIQRLHPQGCVFQCGRNTGRETSGERRGLDFEGILQRESQQGCQERQSVIGHYLRNMYLVEEVWGIDKRMRPWSHGNIVLFRRQFKESRWGVMKPCTMEVKRTKEKDINRWKIGTPREGACGEWCEMPIPGSLQREEA